MRRNHGEPAPLAVLARGQMGGVEKEGENKGRQNR